MSNYKTFQKNDLYKAVVIARLPDFFSTRKAKSIEKNNNNLS